MSTQQGLDFMQDMESFDFSSLLDYTDTTNQASSPDSFISSSSLDEVFPNVARNTAANVYHFQQHTPQQPQTSKTFLALHHIPNPNVVPIQTTFTPIVPKVSLTGNGGKLLHPLQPRIAPMHHHQLQQQQKFVQQQQVLNRQAFVTVKTSSSPVPGLSPREEEKVKLMTQDRAKQARLHRIQVRKEQRERLYRGNHHTSVCSSNNNSNNSSSSSCRSSPVSHHSSEAETHSVKLSPTHATTGNKAQRAPVKKQNRLIRNRESAQASRERQKHYVETLETQVDDLSSQNSHLFGQVKNLEQENELLKKRLELLEAKILSSPSTTASLLPPNAMLFSAPITTDCPQLANCAEVTDSNPDDLLDALFSDSLNNAAPCSAPQQQNNAAGNTAGEMFWTHPLSSMWGYAANSIQQLNATTSAGLLFVMIFSASFPSSFSPYSDGQEMTLFDHPAYPPHSVGEISHLTTAPRKRGILWAENVGNTPNDIKCALSEVNTATVKPVAYGQMPLEHEEEEEEVEEIETTLDRNTTQVLETTSEEVQNIPQAPSDKNDKENCIIKKDVQHKQPVGVPTTSTNPQNHQPSFYHSLRKALFTSDGGDNVGLLFAI